MRTTIPLLAGALMLCAPTAALAQFGGGGGNTTRPSYDNPRAYDRDSQGNETYRYYSSPDEMQRARLQEKKKKKKYRRPY